jgi:predicted GH43/DUF377 family glycosyl hydrolase
MFKWKKFGLIFDPIEFSDSSNWRYNYAQGQNSIELEDRIRVFFCSREKPDLQGRTISRVYFVDLDKDEPNKIIKVSDYPVIETGDLGTFDEHGMYPFSAVKYKGEVYGYYGGVTRCESIPFTISIGCVVSSDNGKTFQRLGKGPVLSKTLYEPYMTVSPKVRIFNGKWYMFYSAGYKWTLEEGRPEICYKLRMAISNDGIVWEKLGKNIIDDKLGELESQASADVIYKNGKYHMFYSYRKHTNFRNNRENSYRIGYAFSIDLINWIRDDDKSGIDVSTIVGAWDYEMIAYPHIFESNGYVYMLYLGNEVGRDGFGLAKLIGELS